MKTEERSGVSAVTQSDHCLVNLLLKPCTGIVADTEHQAVNRCILEDDATTMMMIMTIIMMMDITGEHRMSDTNQVAIATQVVAED